MSACLLNGVSRAQLLHRQSKLKTRSACIAGVLERDSVNIVGNETWRHSASYNVAAEMKNTRGWSGTCLNQVAGEALMKNMKRQ